MELGKGSVGTLPAWEKHDGVAGEHLGDVSSHGNWIAGLVGVKLGWVDHAVARAPELARDAKELVEVMVRMAGHRACDVDAVGGLDGGGYFSFLGFLPLALRWVARAIAIACF